MGKKILIVDDDPEIVTLLTRWLRNIGYEIIAAYDSYQCLKMAQEVRPDLILLDVMMPAGGGINAFNNLKSSVYTSTIPIIFITVDPEEVKKQVKEFSIDGLFEKPFNRDDIINKIKELIGE